MAKRSAHLKSVPRRAVPPTETDSQKANILIVDDHPENLLVLETTLESLGQNIIRANSGKEALRHVLKHEFAVILLDVQMPDLDGFETAVLIRERERSKQTPLIFVTAISTSDAYVFKGYSLGAVDYILKPIAAEILRSKVSVFVDLYFKSVKIREQADALRIAQKAESERKFASMKRHMQVRAEERIASIVEIAPDSIITVDKDHKVRLFNKGAEAMFGISATEILGKPVESLLPDISPDSGWMSDEQREIVARRPDGTSFPAEGSFSILTQDDETLFTFILRDITERKRAEEELRLFSKELASTNKELKDLLMAASHDLQEPVRRIQIFSDRLMTKCKDDIPDRIKQDITKMHNSALQMHRLINDLLAFSKVTGQPETFSHLDLAGVLNDVLADLEPRIEELNAKIEIGTLPTVEANPLQMRQLFQNLIGNALKFHSSERAPVIKISSSVGARKATITIEDNGIGFDEKYLGKIFTIFERLHGRDEYEGTGIGLAICRKIAERHGGSITAKGIPGDGATFIVELPITQK